MAIPSVSVENSFIGGLKTEFTGLNFPENACTSVENCVFTLIGDVLRREGIDFEVNFTSNGMPYSTPDGVATSTYKWNNVGGDGETQIVVVQIGKYLFFFQSTNSTTSSPLSSTELINSVDISSYLAAGSSANPALTECQYADGNGYLFVFNPTCDPIYCTFIPGVNNTVISNVINVEIRDFVGIYPEPGNSSITFRPTSLSAEHNYNLQNQGWTDSAGWTTECSHNDASFLNVQATTIAIDLGTVAFTNVGSGISAIQINDPVSITCSGNVEWTNGGVNYGGSFSCTGSGVVTAYAGSTLTINVTSTTTFSIGVGGIDSVAGMTWNFSKDSSITDTIGVWVSALSNYPSNADIWYIFKDAAGAFSPSTTIGNIALSTTPAPQGHFVVSAFNQNKSAAAGVSGLTSVTTTVRPRTGCWFAGRVWYAGVDASQNATGDAPFYTWTENLYFSQIVTDITQIGNCFQANDPTDENFFDLLDTDGGVVTIQGCGAIYKLFPVQNGLLVFAANGIWFITGRQGIGFAATDYTVTKISGVQSIASMSFVNVLGYPVFWNEEGIYTVSPGNTGSLTVENMCLGTILTFYQNIPLQSKKFARGDYDPVNYELQFIYKSTNETSINDRYHFDSFLLLNTVNKAFYTYTLPALTGQGNTPPFIRGINYVAGPGGSNSPAPTMKYLTTFPVGGDSFFTFSDEHDIRYVDWFSVDNIGTNFISSFTTGYKLRGQPKVVKGHGAMPFGYAFSTTKWQPLYVYMFLRNAVNNSYGIRGMWEFSTAGNSGKWSTQEIRNNTTSTTNFGMIFNRHKIRGHGLVLQLQINSVAGKPFDIMGWSIFETQNDNP